MSFDFYQHYKNYSNIELLKIVKRPSGYEPDALAAALQTLSERHLSNDEIQLVDQYFQDIDNTEKTKKEKINAWIDKVLDFLDPILHPAENVAPAKWVNILLLVIFIQYAWSLINRAKFLIWFFSCDSCSIDITFLAEFLSLFYVPLIFFLLFKRKRWGWILLFVDNLLLLILNISNVYPFFMYRNIHHGSIASLLFPILIKAAFVYFLWRDPVVNYFGVSLRTKEKAAFITTVAAVLFISLMYSKFGS